MKKTPTLFNQIQYATLKRSAKSLMREAEKAYYCNKIDANKSNMKATWRILNDLAGKPQKKTIPDKMHNYDMSYAGPEPISEAFAGFFSRVGRDISESIADTQTSPDSYLSGDYPHSFFFEPTTEQEILTVISQMRNSSAGHDTLRPQLIKDNCLTLTKPITHIINLSLSQGVVPDALKIARITPVYKAGDITCINNYRPISVLTAISKIMEKVVCKRVTSFLDRHNVITNSQFGFRRHHSCEQPLVLATDFIRRALDDGDHVMGVFLDLRKAFDVVSHRILLSKLSHYGIRGLPLSWFNSYLSNRMQSVKIAGATSSEKVITHGVPQGSVLGPLLFLLYINDLTINTRTQNIRLFLFADDTTLLIRHRNVDDLTALTNTELAHMSKWFDTNKLSLNVDKTKYILFTLHNNIRNTPLEIAIKGTNIERTSHIKFLGVTVDETLTWESHISNIASKISKSIGIIRKVAHKIPQNTRIHLYNALIVPYFTYCHIIWSTASQTRLNRLNLLQKRAVRCIALAPYLAHSQPLLSSLKIMPFFNLRDYHSLTFLYKYINQMLPNTFTSQFLLHPFVPSRPSRLPHPKLQIPFFRTSFGQKSLCFTLSKLHNEFAAPLQLLNLNYSAFKKHLQTLLQLQ